MESKYNSLIPNFKQSQPTNEFTLTKYYIISKTYEIFDIYLPHPQTIIDKINNNNHIDLIICKNTSDGIRLYNILSNRFCTKDKNIYFIGRCRRNTELQTKLFNLIQKKTGWNKKDIYRSSTRH